MILSAIIDVDNFIQDTNSLGGQSSQDIDGWKDKIKLASANLANATYQLEGTQELFDANYVAKIELDRDALSRDSYKIQEEEAIVSLNLYKIYDFPKQVQTFLSAYFESKRVLERTYARARAQLAQARSQLESAKERFELQRDRLEKGQKQLAACVIKAPAPGLVVYGSSMDTMSRYRGAGLIAPGETVYQRQTIISLPDTSSMMAEIAVHESSVDKIKPGQKATIVMDAFPDQTFNGEVIKVASLPDQQRNWLSPDIKVYTTQVSIEGTHSFLKPGMSARVEIFVDYAPNALIVPVQVVANRSGKKVCFTVNGGKSIEKEVKTGLFNDTWVQILEGLNEGEEVMLNPPRINETKKESEKQLADKFPKNGQQPQPVLAKATDDPPQTSEPNRADRKRQGMPMGMTGPEGMSWAAGVCRLTSTSLMMRQKKKLNSSEKGPPRAKCQTLTRWTNSPAKDSNNSKSYEAAERWTNYQPGTLILPQTVQSSFLKNSAKTISLVPLSLKSCEKSTLS